MTYWGDDMSRFDYDRYEALDYSELEVELSKLTQHDKVEVLSNILCQEFYLTDHIEHIKKVLLILLKTEDVYIGSQ